MPDTVLTTSQEMWRTSPRSHTSTVMSPVVSAPKTWPIPSPVTASKHLHYLNQPGKDLGEAPEPGDQDSGSEGRSCHPLPLPDPLHQARPSPPSAMSQLSPAGLGVPLEGVGPAEEGMEGGGRKVGCLTEGGRMSPAAAPGATRTLPMGHLQKGDGDGLNRSGGPRRSL